VGSALMVKRPQRAVSNHREISVSPQLDEPSHQMKIFELCKQGL
jgi:hypothetical protein